jgi:hypothetical protein
MNMIPKQPGQATVASRAPQCSQQVASLDAAAPHIGQFKVAAATGESSGNQPFCQTFRAMPRTYVLASSFSKRLILPEPSFS